MPGLNRRHFLQAAGTASVAGLVAGTASPVVARPADKPSVRYRLGIVTYNIAAAWDLPTILKVCKDVGVSPVELPPEPTDYPPRKVAEMLGISLAAIRDSIKRHKLQATGHGKRRRFPRATVEAYERHLLAPRRG